MLNKISFSNKINKGFTFLEVIITIFVMTMGILGAIFVIQQTIILTSYSSSKLIAAYLTQEGFEIVRNIRDTNWLKGKNWRDGLEDGDYQADYDDSELENYNQNSFLNIDTDGFYSYNSSNSPTKFQRKITLTALNSSIPVFQVSVEVMWQDREKKYSFSAKENLYNWR